MGKGIKLMQHTALHALNISVHCFYNALWYCKKKERHEQPIDFLGNDKRRKSVKSVRFFWEK